MKRSIENKTLTLKNFRVFDNKGASIKFSPITILTGCNSSGKSSIVKSLLLLESYLYKIKKELEEGKTANLSSNCLDFYTRPNNLLGNFNKVLNINSHGKDITYEITTYSHMLGENIIVSFIFSSEKDDVLMNGYLKHISFANERGEIFYQSSRNHKELFNEDNNKGNLNLLINSFKRYLQLESFIAEDNNYFKTNEEEIALRESKDSLQKKYGKDSIKDVIWYLKNCPYPENDAFIINSDCIDSINKFLETDLIFYMPIVEEVDKYSNNIEYFLKGLIGNVPNKQLIEKSIDKEIRLYENSGMNSFLDYYKKLENSFIKSLKTGSSNFFKGIKPPYLVTLDCLDISNAILEYSLDGSEELVEFIDEEGTRIETATEKEKRITLWKNTRSFTSLFGLLADLSLDDNSFRQFFNVVHFEGCPTLHGYLAKAFLKFVKNACEMLLSIEIPAQLHYVSSTIVPIKLLYPLDSNDSFTQNLKEYFEAKRNYLKKKKQSYVIDSFMNKWAKNFQIGESISVRPIVQGLGITITINKSQNKKIPLADEGYGISQLFALLLRIETVILNTRDENDYYSYRPYNDVAWAGHTIAIEEPEIHFHPNYQSMLAELFLDAYKNYNIRFIIETHSEYLIRKFQAIVANKELSSSDISIPYLENPDKNKRNGKEQVRNIHINNNGTLSEPFGEGFFDEARNLAIDIVKKGKLISEE